MTTAGDLKWRVRFDKRVEENDPAGGVLSNWQEQFSRLAAILPQKGRMMGEEPVMAQRLTGLQPYIIIVRFDSLTRTIVPDWRAVEMLNGVPVRYFAIKSPPEDMERKRQWISMTAVAGEADGGTAP